MTFLRVMLFSLVVVLSYTLFANIVPQVQSDPPAEEKVDPAALDAAGQIAWGERLFSGKGTCTLCHNKLGRAPDMLTADLGKVFAERLAAPGYARSEKEMTGPAAVEAYLRESMLAPSAYVVPGFGKKGTNDTVSQMPKVDGPPISLSPDEIDALIAFLQNRAGSEVTVALPAKDVETPAETDSSEEEDEPVETAEAAIQKYLCSGCHDLAGSGANAAPQLAGISRRMDQAALRRSIIDPNADIAKGFQKDVMPPDYGKQMRVSELELLIAYLMKLPPKKPAK